MACLNSKHKLIYQGQPILINQPSSYEDLRTLCILQIPDLLPDFLIYGVNARGKQPIENEEQYRALTTSSAGVFSYEVIDQTESNRILIRPYSLIGFQCLHPSAFRMQVLDLDSMKLQSRLVESTPGFSYVVTANAVVITGGREGFLHSAVQYSDGLVTRLPDLISPHAFHVSVTDAMNLLFVLGGKDNKENPSKKCEVLNFSTNSWERLPDFPRKAMIQTGCCLSGKVYVLSNLTLDRLDSNEWTQLFTLPESFLGAPLVPISTDQVLVYGGLKDHQTMILHIPTLSIEALQEVPARGKLHYYQPAKHRGRVYCYAGKTSQVLAFVINERKWRFISEEFWLLRKGVILLHALGHSCPWSIWKLPTGVLRDIASEYLQN